MPLCLVRGAHGAIHPSRGWHGKENRPLIFLSNWHGPVGKARLHRAGPYQPGPQDGEREYGRKGGGKEAPLNDLLGLFPWRWLRKRSELSQRKQIAASIHHHSNHAGHTCCWDVRIWGGTWGSGLSAFLLLAALRRVSEAASEG